MSALSLRLVRSFYVREQALVVSWRHGWQRWWWVQSWWPPGLWCNGRIWLWQQRVLALARLPLTRAGWRSRPLATQTREAFATIDVPHRDAAGVVVSAASSHERHQGCGHEHDPCGDW